MGHKGGQRLWVRAQSNRRDAEVFFQQQVEQSLSRLLPAHLGYVSDQLAFVLLVLRLREVREPVVSESICGYFQCHSGAVARVAQRGHQPFRTAVFRPVGQSYGDGRA